VRGQVGRFAITKPRLAKQGRGLRRSKLWPVSDRTRRLGGINCRSGACSRGVNALADQRDRR